MRAQETELPREVSLGFTDGRADYRRARGDRRGAWSAASRAARAAPISRW